jgi:hypothetical protein
MMKPITGQYECVHRSGIGLDYFTSRIDHLTLQAGGRFVLTAQDRSRVSNAAQSLLSGQQVTNAAPETRREGSYTLQGNVVSLRFDDGTQEQGQLAWNGEGLQMGADFYNKVSDSTLLPPTHRMQQNMEDIAKGLKIAGAIGGMAIKAAKTIQDTIQSTQGPAQGQVPTQGAPPAQGTAPPAASPPLTVQPAAPTPAPPSPVQSTVNTVSTAQSDPDALFCDQCGARRRPGKRFCNNCGARLD